MTESRKVMRGLVPETVVVVEGPVGDHAEELWPEEAAHIARAVDKRRSDFSTGRAFARRALAVLGQSIGPLPVNTDRSPAWPRGVTGSISHTDAYCAVAVGRKDEIAAIGIDIEVCTRFQRALLLRILTPEELGAQIAGRDTQPQQRRGAAIFSAKESLYKCLSAVTTVRLDFHDCVVEIEDSTSAFEAQILKPVGPFAERHRFVGKYIFAGDLVATAIILPA